MKGIGTLIIVAVIACMFACGNNDSAVPDQREIIERFLDGNNLEYEIVQGVYRHFGGEREETAEIAGTGDSLEIFYDVHRASYTRESSSSLKPDIRYTLYSNKPYTLDTLSKYGLNLDFWPEGSEKIKLGSTGMITGLERGLANCRQGDSVLLFITSDLAYGDKTMSSLDANTAILYIVNIDKVVKQ